MKIWAGALAAAIAVVATSAFAADPIKPIPVIPAKPPVYFDGFYLGGHVGYGTGQRTGCFEKERKEYQHPAIKEVVLNTVVEEEDYCRHDFDYDQKGWIVGGQMGVNHRLGFHNLVIGAEVSASLSGMTGNLELGYGSGGVGDWKWFGTGTGKLGLVLMNHVMVYGEAGVAVASFDFTSSGCTFSSNHQGIVYGGGIEIAHGAKNTWFVEYNHIDFDTKDAYCSGSKYPIKVVTNPSVDLIKVGFNHFFN